MNKVYLVMENGRYDDEENLTIIGVYDSEEKARQKWLENIEDIKKDSFMTVRDEEDLEIEDTGTNFLVTDMYSSDYVETWYCEKVVE